MAAESVPRRSFRLLRKKDLNIGKRVISVEIGLVTSGPWSMGNMYRIAMSRLLMVLRLVIVVSLAGYNLSTANAAMHGSAFPEFQKTASEVMPHGDHEMATMSGHSHGDTASDDDGGASKIVKKECCKDFCAGFGIICSGHDVGGPVVTSIRQFIDDRHTAGERPTLDRPPNI